MSRDVMCLGRPHHECAAAAAAALGLASFALQTSSQALPESPNTLNLAKLGNSRARSAVRRIELTEVSFKCDNNKENSRIMVRNGAVAV